MIAPHQLVPTVHVDMVLVNRWLLPCFLVHRASTSFWRRFAGLSSQPAGVSPAFIRAFSSRLLRCLGTATIVEDLAAQVLILVGTSRIKPITPACVNCSRYSHTVWRREPGPLDPTPEIERQAVTDLDAQLGRPRDCRARTEFVLNITIASHGLRPARDLRTLSARRHTASRRARKSPTEPPRRSSKAARSWRQGYGKTPSDPSTTPPAINKSSTRF